MKQMFSSEYTECGTATTGMRRWLPGSLLLSAQSVGAELRVIEETAIPYTRFLSKAAFDQRFPVKYGRFVPAGPRMVCHLHP